MEVSVSVSASMATLVKVISEQVGKPVATLRLCTDGERLPATQTAASVAETGLETRRRILPWSLEDKDR